MADVAVTRTRDPERREKILSAATTLVARNGFHSVSMTDIGGEAGITGAGIYRHFDSKVSILVSLFERVIDDLLTDEHDIVAESTDLCRSLRLLIDGQVEFVVGNRAIAQVYHNEIQNLPDEDHRRLRRKQRLYIEEWVHLLRELRPGLDGATARTSIHAAIGAIQSSLFHNVGLTADRLRETLANAAAAVLELP